MLILKKPQIGSTDWGTTINDNFKEIENNVNGNSTSIRQLQNQVKSFSELTIGGFIDIAKTIVTDTEVTLSTYAINADGTPGLSQELSSAAISPNTCYKVLTAFTAPNTPNTTISPIYNPCAYDWAQGDFLVVGDLNTTATLRKISRLPISIGMYMKPETGTGINEGKIIWTPTMAATSVETITTIMPLQYAYGTVNTYPINFHTSQNLRIGGANNEQLHGAGSYTYFPRIEFYMYISQGTSGYYYHPVMLDYTLTREPTTDGSNNWEWVVHIEPSVDWDENYQSSAALMVVTMISATAISTKNALHNEF